MWISKKKLMELNRRVDELEKQTEELCNEVNNLKQGILVKICTNSVMKEQYNFELLKYLFEKMDIKQPVLEYDFVRRETPSNKNGERN